MDRYFLVKNQLVQEPKHKEKMGEAIWLYLFYLSFSNCNNGLMKCYVNSCLKCLGVNKEWWETNNKILEKNGYILYKLFEKNIYLIEIIKPIKK